MSSVLCVGTGRHVQCAAETLAAADFTVATAPDVESTVETLGRSRPDCIVTALDLSEESAIELLDRIDGRVPTVVCAASGSESAAGEVVAAGADGYVPASEIDDALVDRVWELVDGGTPAAAGRTPGDPGSAAVDGSQSSIDATSARSAFTTDEQRLPPLLHQAPLTIIAWDTAFEIVGWNAAATELLGYSADDVLGEGVTMLLPEHEREYVKQFADRVLEGETTHVINDNVTANGERITCRWHNTPLVEDGEVVGAVSFAQDVTEEVRRAETLEALHWATGDLFQADTPESVAERTATAAEGVLDADFAAVHVYDEDADAFDLIATSDSPEAVPPVKGTFIEDAFHEDVPRGVDRLSTAEFDAADLPIDSLESHPLGDHGILSFGTDDPAGVDAWTAKLGALLAATGEAALDRAHRERRLRRASAIVEAIGDGIYTLDERGTFVDVNEVFLDITGYEREELVGRDVQEIAREDTIQRGQRIVETLLETDPNGVRTDEFVFETKDGSWVDLEVTVSLLTEDGEFDGSVGIVRNVTERKRMERELRAERDRFAALFESVPDPIVRARIDEGDDAIVLDVNPAFERVFGYDGEEIVGDPLGEYIVPQHGSDRAQELNRRGFEEGIVECEVQRMTTTGIRDFQLTIFPIETEEGEPVSYGVYTDITERKQRQQRLEVLNRVLRHDLRNGMNIVRGAAEALADHVGDDTALTHVETIEQRAGELIDLAEKTRVVERTLARDPDEVSTIDLVDVVERTVDRVGSGADAVSIRTDLPPEASVRADDLLPAAIRHVVENAVDHHDGEPSLEIAARHIEDRDAVELTVADDGPGIPPSERELVTEQREITQLHHASGLGLWLVNWVVTGSGGDLAIEDNDPRGTIVTIVLPTATPEDRDTTVTGN